MDNQFGKAKTSLSAKIQLSVQDFSKEGLVNLLLALEVEDDLYVGREHLETIVDVGLKAVELNFQQTQWVMFTDKAFSSPDEKQKSIETNIIMSPWDYGVETEKDIEDFASCVLVLTPSDLKNSSKVFQTLFNAKTFPDPLEASKYGSMTILELKSTQLSVRKIPDEIIEGVMVF